MNINRFTTGLSSAALAAAIFAGFLTAQTPPRPPAPASDLNQLMRGLFFPQANVFFDAQRHNPGEIKWAPEPSGATDPLMGVFGGWEATENSALMLTEAADLLMTPGRKCSNGRDVPLARPEWIQFVKDLREAGAVALKAARSKDNEAITNAANQLNGTCSDCHAKYRPRVIANRCQ